MEDSMIDIAKLVESANKSFAKLIEARTALKEASDMFVAMNGESGNPFSHAAWEFDRAINTVRKSLILQVGCRIQETIAPNIPWDRIEAPLTETINRQKGSEGFDAGIIKTFFETCVAPKAAVESFNVLRSQAHALVPYRSGKPPLQQDIVKGRVLELSVYLEGDFNDNKTLPYRYWDNMEAFETLAVIISQKKDPSSTRSKAILELMKAKGSEKKLTGVKYELPSNPVFHSIKVFKNGRIDVEFNRPQDAMAVAQVLIQPIDMSEARKSLLEPVSVAVQVKEGA
jgi:hypothetical protein